MKPSLFSALAFAVGALASTIPDHRPAKLAHEPTLRPRYEPCENTPKSRHCWGKYSIDTNYYDVIPDTGRTVEYWLSVQEGPCAPDGYQRTCMTFNGTIPGPTIIANWGDKLKIHVTNNMASNGTSIHWHGVRQLNSALADGVPGVTQCPIAPGKSMTYEFHVTQYGSSWYHSHFSLQYSEGLLGGMVFHGPATEDYDEDLGTLLLQDWSHIEIFNRWNVAKTGRAPTLESSLINGTNTYNCTSSDPKCVGSGKKFETLFECGKKYRFRLVNVAVDGVFQFSIDGHELTVIANDFVPIKPYKTDSIKIAIGQRYDVIVEAKSEDAALSEYWLRGGWVSRCAPIGNINGVTGIVRYNKSSQALPNTTSTVTPATNCLDEPHALVPHLSLDVDNIPAPNLVLENLNFTIGKVFQWTINSSSLVLDWSRPTMQQIFNNETIFPTPYNVVSINHTSSSSPSYHPASYSPKPRAPTPEFAVLIIQDVGTINLAHPIHLHGHDFWILAQTPTAKWDGTTKGFSTKNPTRRDVATMPPGGYLALAFMLDNPGAWLVHCHIAWHASQGLSLEFVEEQGEIVQGVGQRDKKQFGEVCEAWRGFKPVWMQDDSGI